MGCCYSKPNGLCIVCMYECNTKVCKCSFMHQECADTYFSIHSSLSCQICRSRFKKNNLQALPKLSEEDAESLRQWQQSQQIRRRAERHALRQWSSSFFPNLSEFLNKYTYHTRNVRLALETIDHEENREVFIQYAMDRGMKRNEVECHMRKVAKLHRNYHFLPRKTRRMLTQRFLQTPIASSYSSTSSSE